MVHIVCPKPKPSTLNPEPQTLNPSPKPQKNSENLCERGDRHVASKLPGLFNAKKDVQGLLLEGSYTEHGV